MFPSVNPSCDRCGRAGATGSVLRDCEHEGRLCLIGNRKNRPHDHMTLLKDEMRTNRKKNCKREDEDDVFDTTAVDRLFSVR